MDIKFDRKSSGSQQDAGDGKGKQNALLVLLLILVGAFAYIYFFTGLIKPMEEKKAGEATPAAVAKKPLPPVEGAAAKPEGAPAEAKKDAAAPAAQPAAPAPEAPKAKAEQKPDADVQAAVKKPLPGAVPPAPAKPTAAPAPAKPAPQPAAKPAAPAEKKVAEAKPQPAKEAEKKPADAKAAPAKPAATAAAAPAKPKKDTPKPAKKEAVAAEPKGTVTGGWTVLVGNYVLEEALAADMTKVRKAGLQSAITAGGAKKTHMNRLLLAEYTDREAAQAELAKLKKFTSDAFMIDKAGMHGVYAGSYLLDTRAAAEKARLGAAGFKLTLTRVDVSIPSKNLTAGTFADKAAAEEAVKKLKAADIKATLTR